jgi:putative ABC transport system permease protein
LSDNSDRRGGVLLEGWLYGVKPLDPITFAAGGLGVLCLSLAAAYVPARRAIRVDPLVTLRMD